MSFKIEIQTNINSVSLQHKVFYIESKGLFSHPSLIRLKSIQVEFLLPTTVPQYMRSIFHQYGYKKSICRAHFHTDFYAQPRTLSPFFFLGLHPQHIEVPRPGVESELQLLATATATRDPSCVCDLHHSSCQCQILNPLSKARYRTHVLVDTSLNH